MVNPSISGALAQLAGVTGPQYDLLGEHVYVSKADMTPTWSYISASPPLLTPTPNSPLLLTLQSYLFSFISASEGSTQKTQATTACVFRRCLTKIRTWTGRTKICSATITPWDNLYWILLIPNVHLILLSLDSHQSRFCDSHRICGANLTKFSILCKFPTLLYGIKMRASIFAHPHISQFFDYLIRILASD